MLSQEIPCVTVDEVVITPETEVVVEGVDTKFIALALESSCHPAALDEEQKILTVSVSHKHLLDRLLLPQNRLFVEIFLNAYLFAPEEHYSLKFVLESEWQAAQAAKGV